MLSITRTLLLAAAAFTLTVSAGPLEARDGHYPVDGCKRYATPQSGQTCTKFAHANGISVEKLRRFNNGLNDGCTNLWAGVDACVEA